MSSSKKIRTYCLRDCHQISLSANLSELYYFLFPLKSSENLQFSYDFRGNRCKLIPMNSLNARSEMWQ